MARVRFNSGPTSRLRSCSQATGPPEFLFSSLHSKVGGSKRGRCFPSQARPGQEQASHGVGEVATRFEVSVPVLPPTPV